MKTMNWSSPCCANRINFLRNAGMSTYGGWLPGSCRVWLCYLLYSRRSLTLLKPSAWVCSLLIKSITLWHLSMSLSLWFLAIKEGLWSRGTKWRNFLNLIGISQHVVNIPLSVPTDDCANARVDVVEGLGRADSVWDVTKRLGHVVWCLVTGRQKVHVTCVVMHPNQTHRRRVPLRTLRRMPMGASSPQTTNHQLRSRSSLVADHLQSSSASAIQIRLILFTALMMFVARAMQIRYIVLSSWRCVCMAMIIAPVVGQCIQKKFISFTFIHRRCSSQCTTPRWITWCAICTKMVWDPDPGSYCDYAASYRIWLAAVMR